MPLENKEKAASEGEMEGAQVDELVGTGARSVRFAMQRIKDIKEYLDTKASADLVVEFGYTSTEADTIKSAFADLAKFAGIFDGTQTQSPAYDFRTFARRVWGLGVANTSST